MIVYLTPRSPFTKGALRSDTLFGAIAWAIRWLYGEPDLQQLMNEFDLATKKQIAPPLTENQLEPPFVLSSLFPYFSDENGRILFLPRPLTPPFSPKQMDSPRDYQVYKRMRKANYVSQTVFEQIACGELNESQIFDELIKEEGEYALQAQALMTRAERQRVKASDLIIRGEAARNAINRLTISTGGDGGQLYYEPITASPAFDGMHGGFYFFARTGGDRKDKINEMLKAALRFLGDKGFGGDTSIGRGHCDISFDDGEVISGCPGGTRLMTLSLFHPSPDDRAHLSKNQRETFARLERRKGFIESAYSGEIKQVWKPTLFMLGEGATFPSDGSRKIYGELFTDDHKREGLQYNIRINGLAYTVAMKGEATR